MRRYSPLKPSRGTLISAELRGRVWRRDGICVGPKVGMPVECAGVSEIDHVRASHAIGMKSRTEYDNLVALCSTHHRLKTLDGRRWRPVLLAYLETVA